MNRTYWKILSAATLLCGMLAARAFPGLAPQEQWVHLTAKKFEYSPTSITVKRGHPVAIEIVSLDRRHGFVVPGLAQRVDVKPGQTNVVRFTPETAGTFPFHCDVFCGGGHEGMEGTLVVTDE